MEHHWPVAMALQWRIADSHAMDAGAVPNWNWSSIQVAAPSLNWSSTQAGDGARSRSEVKYAMGVASWMIHSTACYPRNFSSIVPDLRSLYSSHAMPRQINSR